MLGIATFKRLDDGYYEQQLVAEQLRNLSGHFYDGNDAALADMKRMAELEAGAP